MRPRAFWDRAFDRLSGHPTQPGCPRHGYLLESGGTVVGAILLIFAPARSADGTIGLRCNVSSWYVEPAFRIYGSILITHALRRKDATYFNVTPAPHTLPLLAAQGYAKYCSGRVFAAPVLSAGPRGARVEAVAPGIRPGADLDPFEVELLLAHEAYGCLSVVCVSAGQRYPFVFAPRRKYGLVRFAFLIYCRGVESFVRFAGPLGRFLARHGLPLVVLDANGPVRGLAGVYRGANPKYFKGPVEPPLGDVAYSERAMFGV